jgi:hypothetical protein
MSIPQNIGLEIRNITLKNRQFKFRKAMGELAETLNISPPLIKALPHKAHKQEPYFYNVQQQLSDRWVKYFDSIIHNVYKTIIDSLGLPMVEVETMKKALDDGILRYKGGILKFIPFYRGKILYSPETGQPIQKKEFEALIKAIENFLNRKTGKAGDQIVLDSVAIGKLLRRMSKYQTSRELEALTLEKLKYQGKTYDWIRESVKNIRNALGEELFRREQAMYQAARDWAAAKVTHLNNVIKDEIKDTILYGIREHRGKAQIAQDLFNKMGGLNRDWKRIADTEIVNTSNLAGILEEVNQRPVGEKVYFKRYELPGCCDKCAKIDGMVVLWSDIPLENDHIKDPYAKIAIWEGKPQDKKMNSVVTGTIHPNCYSDDTEVMTGHGWKLFNDLLNDDKIMSINPNNQEVDFVHFINRTSYEYNGKMVHFSGRNYDLSVTPDHNMLFVSQKGFYREATAQSLLNKRNYKLPRAVGKWVKKDTEVMVDFGDLRISKKQYFRLWAWYLAEGNGRTRDQNSHEVKLAQKFPEKIINDLPELNSILHKNHYSVSLYGKYAAPFKDMFGIYAAKKFIPQFIKDSSAENIREFLDAFSLADGTKRIRKAHKKSYSDQRKEQYVRTSSKQMADDLCELIVKAGWIPSVDIQRQTGEIIHFDNGDYVINTDCYNINVCKSKYRGFGMHNIPGHKERHEPVEVDYKGMVYDVELEKWHFLLVKRNGKCAWSGNCRGGWMPWDGKTVDAMIAHIENKAEMWDRAVNTARREFGKKGIENPTDQTKGYTDRINEIYQGLVK